MTHHFPHLAKKKKKGKVFSLVITFMLQNLGRSIVTCVSDFRFKKTDACKSFTGEHNQVWVSKETKSTFSKDAQCGHYGPVKYYSLISTTRLVKLHLFFFCLLEKKEWESIQQLGGNKGIIDSPVKLTCKVREKHSVWHEDLSTDYFI